VLPMLLSTSIQSSDDSDDDLYFDTRDDMLEWFITALYSRDFKNLKGLKDAVSPEDWKSVLRKFKDDRNTTFFGIDATKLRRIYRRCRDDLKQLRLLDQVSFSTELPTIQEVTRWIGPDHIHDPRPESKSRRVFRSIFTCIDNSLGDD
jgi:hypothetical protein